MNNEEFIRKRRERRALEATQRGEILAKLKLWFGAEYVPRIFNTRDYVVQMDADKQFVYIYMKPNVGGRKGWFGQSLRHKVARLYGGKKTKFDYNKGYWTEKEYKAWEKENKNTKIYRPKIKFVRR